MAETSALDEMQTQLGTLFLVPSPLDPQPASDPGISNASIEIIKGINHFIVENEKTARRCLKTLGITAPLSTINMSCLNEHTKAADLPALLEPLMRGEDCGLMSEAGCPCVADPGAELVRLAHERGVRVKPLAGPSSILLALMASGLNGQSFSFLGYIPADSKDRARWLKTAERESKEKNQTQIFMDTPYRIQRAFSEIVSVCDGSTLFCVARSLMSDRESIVTESIKSWRKRAVSLGKEPAMFLLLAR